MRAKEAERPHRQFARCGFALQEDYLEVLDNSRQFTRLTYTNPSEFALRPVWAEISLRALAVNLRAIRNYVNPESENRAVPRKVLSVVKANAYGHGGPEAAEALEKAGTDWLGVASVSEGIVIREHGVGVPILVLGGFWPGEETLLIEHNLTTAIHRGGQLIALESAAAKLRKNHVSIHLKVDTGMNRLGIVPKDTELFARELAKCKHLELTAVFTHFASAEVLSDTPIGRQTHEQVLRFYSLVERLRALHIDPGMLHLANSAAIVARPETWADMVRPGAILYGCLPNIEPVERVREFESRLPLQPVMSFRSRIINVRSVESGDAVGYNASWVAHRPSRVAVLAAGYGHGIPRSLGNRVTVAIRGQRAPIVGIVCMDMTMVDVTDIPHAAIGDTATIYGTDGSHAYPATVVARRIGTVASDLLCAVSTRVARFYIP